jgi:hypothetical protein
MNTHTRRHPKGFIAIALFAGIAIVLILYVTMLKGYFPGVSDRGSGVKQDRPWLLDDLIVGADDFIEMPNAAQVDLDDGLELNAAVSRDGSERGVASLLFDAYGEVSGKWECDYTHDEREYSFMATYAGNIVADKEFSGEDGSNDSLLFFIVKGSYTQRKYHEDFGEQITEGIVYLTGWVDRDESLRGKLTITTDDIEDKDKWAASYELRSSGQ